MGLEEIGRNLDRALGGTGWRERPLFDLGLVVMSPAAFEALREAGVPDLDEPFGRCGLSPYLERHRRADWPALSEDERRANLSAIEGGERIVGAFDLPGTGRRVLVVTDAEAVADGWRHRPGTTVLLPEEYGR